MYQRDECRGDDVSIDSQESHVSWEHSSGAANELSSSSKQGDWPLALEPCQSNRVLV